MIIDLDNFERVDKKEMFIIHGANCDICISYKTPVAKADHKQRKVFELGYWNSTSSRHVRLFWKRFFPGYNFIDRDGKEHSNVRS